MVWLHWIFPGGLRCLLRIFLQRFLHGYSSGEGYCCAAMNTNWAFPFRKSCRPTASSSEMAPKAPAGSPRWPYGKLMGKLGHHLDPLDDGGPVGGVEPPHPPLCGVVPGKAHEVCGPVQDHPGEAVVHVRDGDGDVVHWLTPFRPGQPPMPRCRGWSRSSASWSCWIRRTRRTRRPHRIRSSPCRCWRSQRWRR